MKDYAQSTQSGCQAQPIILQQAMEKLKAIAKDRMHMNLSGDQIIDCILNLSANDQQASSGSHRMRDFL